TRFSRDWSSDVCSSDLGLAHARRAPARGGAQHDDPGAGTALGAVIAQPDGARLGLDIDILEAQKFHILEDLPGRGVICGAAAGRSEERRVGKEGRGRWA